MITKTLRIGLILAYRDDVYKLPEGRIYQRIHLLDVPDGSPTTELALVHLPDDEHPEVHDRRVRFRMKAFHVLLTRTTGDEREALDKRFVET